MAKKKKIEKSTIFEAYIEQTLLEEKMPKSVFLFCKHAKIEESEFYLHFGSLDGVRTAIFEAFYKNAMQLLTKNENFEKQSPKEKLLDFYFTFFEVLQLNRSYVLFVLDEKKLTKKWSDLKGLRSHFKEFVVTLIIEGNAEKEGRFSQRSEKIFSEAAWGQLLFLLKFWMNDNSVGFEKTDVAIEKSVQTVFSLFDNNALDTLFDFGKFLWKEKSHIVS